MCPQKWKASASPGLVSAPTAPAPAVSASSLETRARNPRREVEAASSSVSDASSGMGVREPPFRGGQDALQLAVGVERALRAHGAAGVEGDRERASRNPELPPQLSVAHLIEDLDCDERVALERR